MVWGLALLAVAAFAMAFTSHSPGWMGGGIVAGFVFGIAAALAFIERHIRASGRPEHMTDREVNALRSTVRKSNETPRQLPPSSEG